MKTLFGTVILASAMALTACGGGSSDSSGSHDTVDATPTPNTTTPSTPVNNSTSCASTGTTVTGQRGSNCTFSLPSYNGGAVSTLECPASGGAKIGGMSAGNTISLNGVTFQCK